MIVNPLLPQNAPLAVPEWIQLLPPGPKIIGDDDRAWLHDQPDAVIAAFYAQHIQELVIDFEHSTELQATQGHLAPAAGWIDQLEMRNDGSIWGHVHKWTPAARARISAGEYRYISPVFLFEPKTNRIRKLTSVALTNKPNLALAALNRAGVGFPLPPAIQREFGSRARYAAYQQAARDGKAHIYPPVVVSP